MQPAEPLHLLPMLGVLGGGLALFLLGLQFLTDALKALAGAQLEAVLGRLSANRFRGVLAGAAVTALLNSSTITTVLMVGFVSAGLMTLGQTVPMIMGANIGSTLTAQIIAFDVSRLTPFMLAIGFLGHAFARRDAVRLLGGALMGLGLLFLGIQFMGDATRPLRTFQPFIDAMQDMRSPWLGVLAGALFTAVVQSSAATLAIIIALGSQGLMPLEAGIALILGANVGTCGTALLAAVGKPREALQVGVVHLLFNVFGVLMFVFVIPQFAELVRQVSPSAPELEGVARLAAETPRQVANAHTIFSVAGTLVLIWFTEPLARIVRWIVPSRPRAGADELAPLYLDDATMEVPGLALQRARLELVRLGEAVAGLARESAQMTVTGGGADIARLIGRGRDTERLATAILTFVGRLSRVEHSEAEGREMLDLAQVVMSLESVREIASTYLVSITERRLADRVDLAPLGDESTERFGRAVLASFDEAVRLVGAPDADGIAAVVDAKPHIADLATQARNSVLAKLRLDEADDVLRFRLASDIIELFQDIARLSRDVARAMARF